MKNLAKKRTANLTAQPADGFAVDASAGVLRNVALITEGEALSYWFGIDSATLTTALAAIEKNGGQLRIYPTHAHSGCTHGTCADSDEIGSELNYAAYADGIAVKGAQLVAATVQFDDTFRKNYEPQYDTIMELAAKTPKLLGLSIEPLYHAVFVGKDGVEYSARPEGVDLVSDAPMMRVDELYAAAFGAVPAANQGLFAQLTAKFGGKRMKKLIAALTAQLDQPAPKETPKPAEVSVPAPIAPATNSSATMKLIADLQAKYGSDERKLGQAMLIVGKTPADQQAALSIAAVEAQMTSADLTALNGQVTKLTTDLTASNQKVTDLTTQVANLTTERDSWKNKFEALKVSGVAPVNTGAVTTGGGENADNPFLTDNLTAQARIAKSDPTRAEALKQAAAAAKAAKAAGAK